MQEKEMKYLELYQENTQQHERIVELQQEINPFLSEVSTYYMYMV